MSDAIVYCKLVVVVCVGGRGEGQSRGKAGEA